MNTHVMASLLLLLLVACKGNDGGSALPTDLTDGLATQTDCDGYTDSVTSEFTPVAGATRYFYGDIAFTEEGDATGTEALILLPNETWTTANPTDGIECEVIWDIVGKKDTEATCASCDYTLNVTSSLNAGASTCTQDVVNGYTELDGDISYDVTLTCTADGPCTANVSGGSFQAGGFGNDGGLIYIDDGTCQFF